MAGTVDSNLESKYAANVLDPMDDMSAYEAWRGTLHGFWRPARGMRIPEHLMPKRARFRKGKRLFDYNGYGRFRPIISDRLKALMESIEPDVHQFSRVEVFHKDGTPYGGTYWYYVILTCIDAINPIKGGVEKTIWPPPEDYRWTIKSGGVDRLAVYKDRVVGRAMWWDKRHQVPEFYSDALINAMREEKMEGWAVTKYWEEV